MMSVETEVDDDDDDGGTFNVGSEAGHGRSMLMPVFATTDVHAIF